MFKNYEKHASIYIYDGITVLNSWCLWRRFPPALRAVLIRLIVLPIVRTAPDRTACPSCAVLCCQTSVHLLKPFSILPSLRMAVRTCEFCDSVVTHLQSFRDLGAKTGGSTHIDLYADMFRYGKGLKAGRADCLRRFARTSMSDRYLGLRFPSYTNVHHFPQAIERMPQFIGDD